MNHDYLPSFDDILRVRGKVSFMFSYISDGNSL